MAQVSKEQQGLLRHPSRSTRGILCEQRNGVPFSSNSAHLDVRGTKHRLACMQAKPRISPCSACFCWMVSVPFAGDEDIPCVTWHTQLRAAAPNLCSSSCSGRATWHTAVHPCNTKGTSWPGTRGHSLRVVQAAVGLRASTDALCFDWIMADKCATGVINLQSNQGRESVSVHTKSEACNAVSAQSRGQNSN